MAKALDKPISFFFPPFLMKAAKKTSVLMREG
jgi:hypothetical protein